MIRKFKIKGRKKKTTKTEICRKTRQDVCYQRRCISHTLIRYGVQIENIFFKRSYDLYNGSLTFESTFFSIHNISNKLYNSFIKHKVVSSCTKFWTINIPGSENCKSSIDTLLRKHDFITLLMSKRIVLSTRSDLKQTVEHIVSSVSTFHKSTETKSFQTEDESELIKIEFNALHLKLRRRRTHEYQILYPRNAKYQKLVFFIHKGLSLSMNLTYVTS